MIKWRHPNEKAGAFYDCYHYYWLCFSLPGWAGHCLHHSPKEKRELRRLRRIHLWLQMFWLLQQRKTSPVNQETTLTKTARGQKSPGGFLMPIFTDQRKKSQPYNHTVGPFLWITHAQARVKRIFRIIGAIGERIVAVGLLEPA
jgi:hypothetical protein